MLSLATLLPLLAVTPLALATSESNAHKAERQFLPYNPNNVHRHLLSRAITTNTAGVADASFDFIIAGGGVAGLALASRLSEWSNQTVLLVEAGSDGTDFEERIDTPGMSYLNGLSDTTFGWPYYTTPQADAYDLTKKWPRGKGLGGSGATNGLFWCRASKEEYDAWATLNPDGEETWNWEEVQKYIKKSENWTAPPDNVVRDMGMVLDPTAHGNAGPIQIGWSAYMFPFVANWVPSWIALGLKSVDGAAGDTHGVTITPSTINVQNQTRSDSKAGYIDPLPPRANLVILTGQQVTEVIFNGTQDASGNQIASGIKFQAYAGAQSYTVQANKEVILAGGTIGSAQLLQLSGIGPKTVVEGAGLTSRLDLPVGYNLQDHVSASMYWNTPDGTFTWGSFRDNQTLRDEELVKFKADGTGIWTYINEAIGYPSMNDIMADADSTATSYASLVLADLDKTTTDVTGWLTLPDNVAKGMRAQYDIMQKWLTSGVGQLEILLTMLGPGNQVGIQVALQHPWSRGTLFINSSDPFAIPEINPHYFGVGYDIDIMSYGADFARRLSKAAPLSGVMLSETTPGAGTTGDALNEYLKRASGTEYHPHGTASMLPRDSGGVVDTKLVVYGTNNLRVIDASIIPLELSSHLMATTYGIAEKGADLIKAKYMFKEPASENTTASSGSESGSETTAVPGAATDAAVTGASANAETQGLSTGKITGIAVGAGIGALAILGALLAFCLIRRRKAKKEAAAAQAQWYNAGQADQDGAWDVGGAYKEANNSSSYPLSNFRDHSGQGLNAPSAPFLSGNRHSTSASLSTMATADLLPPGAAAARQSSDWQNSGANSPYRDDEDSRPVSPDHHHYPGADRPSQYMPVQR